MKLRRIHILEKDNNKKGDLFGRLMSDLLHALGYEQPRVNVSKLGREIDLSALHRTERKIAIAECKAKEEKIGGADVNKFVGVFDAERRKYKRDKRFKSYTVVPYFISLSEFAETAIEQESDLENDRVILLRPKKIVDELINGKMIVSMETAVSSVKNLNSDLSLVEDVDLIAYAKGWVWAIYFSDSQGQIASHFALVHAGGEQLIGELSEEIIALDNQGDGIFKRLTLVQPTYINKTTAESVAEAEIKYLKYLENELGEIQFEGLPTDNEAGAIKVRLENIFVPLHLIKAPNERKEDEESTGNKREGVGEILARQSRLAILAKPGGGKSTLIKRIAIAYAFPDRRREINDKLPDRPWFPIFIRCRELGEKVTSSITNVINEIPIRAEIASYSRGFSIIISNTLQNGTALLLIDGLDEIADDRHRVQFVNQLRTFIATYPAINIIVTSREAGFRVVGGALATYCEHYKVSNLVENEIEELTVKWHRSVVDGTQNTIKEAQKLSELIIKDQRIRALAGNPLLLTTLLFVKRWAGYLPTKRSVLYQEMIKLLLVTWNVEGHGRLDIEEAEPQLSYVAYWMTKVGQQTIDLENLNKCLVDARRQMPEILGYTTISPAEFIKRVESRSSLLIMSGHKKLDSGNIVPIYEFLHLSFQEYLTAKAIVKNFIPANDAEKRRVDIVKENINNESWKEVIPLVAVLLERDSRELIEYLIMEVQNASKEDKLNNGTAPSLLGNCLANEVQITPELLEAAIEWYAKNRYRLDDEGTIEIILNNKFGAAFRKIVKDLFFEKFEDDYVSELGATLADIFAFDLKGGEEENIFLESVLARLKSDSREDKCIAMLLLMRTAFSRIGVSEQLNGILLESIYVEMVKVLKTRSKYYHFCSSWATAWVCEVGIFPDAIRKQYTIYLLKYWGKYREHYLNRATSWALSSILTPDLRCKEINEIPQIRQMVLDKYSNPRNEFDKLAAIYLGYLIGNDWNREEIKKELNNNYKFKFRTLSNLERFAQALGIELTEESKRKRR